MSTKCKKEDCNAWATQDGYCFSHSPNLKEERVMAQSRGGLVGKSLSDRILVELQPVEINSGKDVISLLAETINLVRGSKIDIRVANCIGTLANYLIRAFETADLEGRVEKVERLILERKTYGSNQEQG